MPTPAARCCIVHGGGYVIGSLDSHRHVAAEISRAAGMRVLALDYRLAPEHPFPAPVEDTLAAYRFLLDSGFAAERIALAGDSAGGGLVVGAMLAIKDAGLTCPARLVHHPLGGHGGAGRPRSPIARRPTRRCRRPGSRRWPATTSAAPTRAPLRRADLRRPARAAAAADPGGRGRDAAGRRAAAGPRGRDGGRARRPADLARDDPCLALCIFRCSRRGGAPSPRAAHSSAAR